MYSEHLRDYQVKAIRDCRTMIRTKSNRVILALPTGAGKTTIASEICKLARGAGNRIVFIVDRLTLINQAREEFEQRGLSIGIIQADNTRNVYGTDVVIASAQSLRNQSIPGDTGLVIIDECHCLHKQHIQILEGAPHMPVIGLSATPLRADLGKYFSELIRGPSIEDLTREGFLVEARAFCPNADEMRDSLRNVEISKGDYKRAQLSDIFRSKVCIGDVIRVWKERGEDRQTICFAVTKAHCRDLRDSFIAEGISAAVLIDGTSEEERVELLRQFNLREIRILISVAVLAVGFDSPIASCVVLARPTLSEALHIQQVGRALRPATGKRDALILDHAGNCLRFGLPVDFKIPDLQCKRRALISKKRRKVDRLDHCRQCKAVLPNDVASCLECGADRGRPRADIVYIDDELVEYGSKKSGKREFTREDKREYYQACLYWCDKNGKSRGAAYYLFKGKFGESNPTTWLDLPVLPPTEEHKKWIRAYWIRRKYQRDKENRLREEALSKAGVDAG